MSNRQWVKSAVVPLAMASLLGYVTTLLFYTVTNGILDERLKQDSHSLSPLTQAIAKKRPAGQSPTDTDVFNVLLYGSQRPGDTARESGAPTNWKEAARHPWLLPYLPSPTQTKRDLINDLAPCPSQTPDCEDWRQDVSVALANPLDDLRDKSGSYLTRRYLNGGIQFATLAFTFTGLFLLVYAFFETWRDYKALETLASAVVRTQNETWEWAHVGAGADRVLAQGTLERNLTMDQVRALIATVEEKAPRPLQTRNPFMVLKSVCLAFLASTLVQEAARTLERETDGLKDSLDGRHGMLRYLIWAVPSLGFIGTVVGIGAALDNAHKVITGEDAQSYVQEGAIQFITANLGVAFDTTLVALLASLVLMFGMALVTSYEEGLVEHLTIVLGRLVSRLKGTPLEELFSKVLQEKSVVNVHFSEERFRAVLRQHDSDMAELAARSMRQPGS